MEKKIDYKTYYKKQEIPKEELETFIQRVYDEELASDLLAPNEVYTLIQLLCPKCPPKVIKNAKKNHSSKKADNILFHLVRAVPRLFIASLHYTEKEREGEPSFRFRSRHRTFHDRIKEHTDELEELYEEMEDVKEGKGMIDKSEHDEEIKELKQKHRDEMDAIKRKLNKDTESTKIQYSQAMYQMKHEIKLKDMEIKCYEERNQLNPNV